MATTKTYYYVLVITTDGPKFVTEVDNGAKTAKWDAKSKPLAMTRERAKDLHYGLLWNFFVAYLVEMPCTLEGQPYLYGQGHFDWIKED